MGGLMWSRSGEFSGHLFVGFIFSLSLTEVSSHITLGRLV